MQNYLLFIFDILCLPITLMRLLLIYYNGSKYNIKGLQFLDVMLHSNDPYFNINNNLIINTLSNDLRVCVRDDSRLYPKDIKCFLENSESTLTIVPNKKDIPNNELNAELNNNRELDDDFVIRQNIFNTTDKKSTVKIEEEDSSCISNKYSDDRDELDDNELDDNELDENTSDLTESISEKAHIRLNDEVEKFYKTIDD